MTGLSTHLSCLALLLQLWHGPHRAGSYLHWTVHNLIESVVQLMTPTHPDVKELDCRGVLTMGHGLHMHHSKTVRGLRVGRSPHREQLLSAGSV